MELPPAVDWVFNFLYLCFEYWYITLPIFFLGETLIHWNKRKERVEDYEKAIRNSKDEDLEFYDPKQYKEEN